jgi:hypothetical protein
MAALIKELFNLLLKLGLLVLIVLLVMLIL